MSVNTFEEGGIATLSGLKEGMAARCAQKEWYIRKNSPFFTRKLPALQPPVPELPKIRPFLNQKTDVLLPKKKNPNRLPPFTKKTPNIAIKNLPKRTGFIIKKKPKLCKKKYPNRPKKPRPPKGLDSPTTQIPRTLAPSHS